MPVRHRPRPTRSAHRSRASRRPRSVRAARSRRGPGTRLTGAPPTTASNGPSTRSPSRLSGSAPGPQLTESTREQSSYRTPSTTPRSDRACATGDPMRQSESTEPVASGGGAARLGALHAHRVVPAVDVQRGARDVLRVVAEQVGGGAGDIGGVDRGGGAASAPRRSPPSSGSRRSSGRRGCAPGRPRRRSRGCSSGRDPRRGSGRSSRASPWRRPSRCSAGTARSPPR